MAAENLPYSGQSLHRADRILPKKAVADSIDSLGRIQILIDRLVAQSRSVVKDRILGAIEVPGSGQAVHRCRGQRLRAVPVDIGDVALKLNLLCAV